MAIHLFESVEQLLSREGLSGLIGSPVDSVGREPLAAEHFSGNTLERVQAQSGAGLKYFVLKRFSIEHDWVMRLTHDTAVREVALYRAGVYARMPEQVRVPLIAAARDGESWASLMIDVTESLVPLRAEPMALADLQQFIHHLAAIHARFMADESLLDKRLGLASLEDFITILSPAVVRREIDAGQISPVLSWAWQGWDLLESAMPPEAVQIVRELQRDSGPLRAQLAQSPQTLVHGDYKFANLGIHRAETAPQTIVLDWQDAAFGSPLLDLGYFLAISSARLPLSKDDVIQFYREALVSYGYRFESEHWNRAVAVGLLGGGGLRLLWQKVLGTQSTDRAQRERAQSEMRWWSEQIIRAGHWL